MEVDAGGWPFSGLGGGPDRMTAQDLFALRGRVALVTGASRGLGLNMAAALAEAGATVYINGRNPQRLTQAVGALARAGITVKPIVFDVNQAGAARDAFLSIVEAESRFDILVSNAGPRLRRPIAEIDEVAFRSLIDSHLVAAFTLSTIAAEWMKPRGWGRIILISSASALRGRSGDAAYIAAKGGLCALSRALASEFGAYGITCNAIVPGRFETEVNLVSASKAPTPPLPRGPLGRFGDPWEIAGACLFLASPASSFVTGIELPVDGGMLSSI